MDSEDRIIVAIIGAVAVVLMALLAGTYYDTAAQRQCREKLATAPDQYRSAADIAQLCK